MTLKDIEFELELNAVMASDIEHILNISKKNGILIEQIDEELVKLGYEKIFDTSDYWNDDDFDYGEKFHRKNNLL